MHDDDILMHDDDDVENDGWRWGIMKMDGNMMVRGDDDCNDG